MKKLIMILMMCLSLTAVAKDKTPMSLSEKIADLGGRPFYVEKENCSSGNCNEIPYDHETEWFWLKKAEKKRRKARNIAKRNEWLLKSGLFPTDSEVKSTQVKARQKELERAVAASRAKSLEAEKFLKDKEDKLAALQKKKANLIAQRETLIDQTRGIFNSSDAATAGSETLLESGKGLLKGQMPLRTNEEEDKILDDLETSQKDLRKVIKEMRDLGSEIGDVQKESGAFDKAGYDKLQEELESNERALENTVVEYGETIARIGPEKERRAAEVKLLNQKAKIDGANAFSQAMIKKLIKDGELAEFVLKDFDDVKKDLKLTELEAKVLLGDVNGKIQQSIIGRYIQEQNEKTLEAAMQGACETAKLCNQHESINNSHIKKDIEPVYQKLKEQLGGSAQK